MRGYIWPLLLAALFGCGSFQNKSAKKKSDIFYEYGSRQLLEGEYTIALENLIKADKMEPNNPGIMNNLALAYYYKKRPHTAQEILRKTIKIAPDHSDTLNNLGTILMKEGQLDEAEKYFKEISKHLLFRKQFVTYHNLSKIAASRGQIKLSRSYNTQSLEEFDRYCPALFHRGLLFYQEKKWEEANISLKEAMEGTCYNYTGGRFYRAMSLKQLNQFEQAEQILEKLKVDFPKSTYTTKIRIELEEIRKIKKSSSYSQRKRSLDVPQF